MTPHTKPLEAPDAGSRQIIWKAVPVGGGFWKLVNSETGEYLEDHGAGGASGSRRSARGRRNNSGASSRPRTERVCALASVHASPGTGPFFGHTALRRPKRR